MLQAAYEGEPAGEAKVCGELLRGNEPGTRLHPQRKQELSSRRIQLRAAMQ